MRSPMEPLAVACKNPGEGYRPLSLIGKGYLVRSLSCREHAKNSTDQRPIYLSMVWVVVYPIPISCVPKSVLPK